MTTRWRSSLANVETALRRSLGLSGPVGTELEDPAVLQPVVIAHDASGPGGAVIRRRHWTASVGITDDSAPTDMRGIIFNTSPTGVVITQITYSARLDPTPPLVASFNCFQIPPGQDYIGLLTPNNIGWFIEGLRSITDYAPILGYTGAFAEMPPASGVSVPVFGGNHYEATLDREIIRVFPTPGLYLAPPPVINSGDFNGPGAGGGLLIGPNVIDGDDYEGLWAATVWGYVY